jgi:CRISPR-associated protein Csx17
VERAVYEFAAAPEVRSLGPLVEELGRAERMLAGNDRVPPLQGLSADWLDAADDGSAEFRIAAALANLFWTESGWRSLIEPVDHSKKGSRFKWREKEHAGLAWSHRPIHDNLAEVLHRIQLRGQDPFPATGRRASLGDIASYLGGQLQEERIERLLFAFLGVRPSHERPVVRTDATGLPATYSILRLLGIPEVLACSADGRWCVRVPDAASRPIRAPAVFPLLRAGRISEGLAMALRALRIAGLAPLAAPRRSSAFALDRAASDRLAGALLIPVWGIPRLASMVLEPPARKEGEHAWI